MLMRLIRIRLIVDPVSEAAPEQAAAYPVVSYPTGQYQYPDT